MGVEAIGTTPEQASAYLKNEIAKYANVVKAIGLKLEYEARSRCASMPSRRRTVTE
jgi:hypothetical protein